MMDPPLAQASQAPPTSFAVPSMVLPPLVAGLAWGLTAQGWSPVPYDGPPLAPPSTSAQLAPPVASTPPSTTTTRSTTSPAITAPDDEPLPPCFEWLATTARTDPRLGAAVVGLAFSFEDERLSRAYLADALRRFGTAPKDFHERAAWIGRIAEHDDFTRATMLSLVCAHRGAEAARVEFRAALAPHVATMPATTRTTTTAAEPRTAAQLAPSAPTPTSTTSTAPSAIPPPTMHTPTPTEARPTAPASSPPPTATTAAAEPRTAAPSTSTSTTATAAQLDRWRTLAERDPQLAEALLRAAKGQDDARRAREHCARALAAHGTPPEGQTFETWAQQAAERDPQFAEALRTYASADEAREQSAAALRAASRARTAPSTTTAAAPSIAATTTPRSTSSTDTAAASWLADVPEEVTARAEHEAPIARALGDLAAARQAKHESEHKAAATIAPHGPPPVDAAHGGAWLAQLAATRPDVAAALAACSRTTADAAHAERALAAALATPREPSTARHSRPAPPLSPPRPPERPPAAQLDARQLDAARVLDGPPLAPATAEALTEPGDAGKLNTAPPLASRPHEPSTHTDPRPRAVRSMRRTFQPRAVRSARRTCSRCAPDRPCTRRRRPRRGRAARTAPSA